MPVWFARNEEGWLLSFIGQTVEGWTSARKVKNGETTYDLHAFQARAERLGRSRALDANAGVPHDQGVRKELYARLVEIAGGTAGLSVTVSLPPPAKAETRTTWA